MIINSEGWFVTVHHIFRDLRQFYEKLQDDHPEGLHWATFFGPPGVTTERMDHYPEIDLCVGKLASFTPPPAYAFPAFRGQSPPPGEILCRIGYPLLEPIPVTWSEPEGFQIAKRSLSIPPFVNEAMVSRILRTQSGPRWLETSTPGLPGQSGGPIVDVHGLVCGIHSSSAEFAPKPPRTVPITTGRAVHVAAIRQTLDTLGISYRTL